ncbi:MAG: formylglycine-generating enzyme family protein [Candidatus Hatepunaea meridiana]|nr:formylglycine-generating enzyme family protein [Candidatus Hatepunaea meridiana]
MNLKTKITCKLLTFILLHFLTLALIISCDLNTPSEPVPDNPIDKNNPGTRGDPYNLQAEIADGGIRLTWQAVDISGLAGYNVYRKDNNSTFSLLAECALQRVSYTDRTIQNGHRYEYYVVVRSATAEGDSSNITTVVIVTDPYFVIVCDNHPFTNNQISLIAINAFGWTHFKISPTSDSTNVDWQSYRDTIQWDLGNMDGWKYVYGWFRNENNLFGPIIDSIGLDTRASISSFTWSATGGDTLVPNDRITFTMQTSDDAFGLETDGSAIVTVEGWNPILLASNADGSYTGYYIIKSETPEVSNARVTVSFTDRVGNDAASVTAGQRLTAWWSPAPGIEREFPLGNTGETIVMCWIPAGSFDMGSPNGEQDRNDDEEPVHRVTFSDGFWIGKYEVTQVQWEAVTNYNPSHDYGVGDNHPVYYVSWDDIQDFESALDNEFRLPSEAEWEYACRAGTTTRFYWGDDSGYDDIDRYAVYLGNSIGRTEEVGTKLPNAWNLYDMNGNVYEWCEDWKHSNYNDAPNDGSAWVSPSRSSRVLRGGSWCNDPWYCRSAYRIGNTPVSRHGDYGFRLVRGVD